MKAPMEIVKEVINTFLYDRKEDKKQFVEWLFNNVMERKARIQLSAEIYKRSDERKAHRDGSRKRKFYITQVIVKHNKL